jgi:hypothetical protein
VRLIAVLLTFAACHDTAPWPTSVVAVDGGLPANNDGSVRAETASMSCGQLESAVQYWLDAHRSCDSDGDCAFVAGLCVAADQCASYYNASANGPYLWSLISAWERRPCANACGQCPHTPPVHPVCAAHQCTFGT